VRELLFKNRTLLKESTHTARKLVLTFVHVVDLFENIMATWYDYHLLREKYKDTGILEEISKIINQLAHEIDGIGEAIQANRDFNKQFDLIAELNDLKAKIDAISDKGSTLMLKKILVNLRNLGEKVDEILKYFNEGISSKIRLRTRKEYSKFVSHQSFTFSVLKINLTFKSSIFRHAMRVMIACGAGFLISNLFTKGHHSYWILMTTIIILKPAFSLTKKKNSDRLLGTIGGGIIGLLLLHFVKDKTVLFAFIAFFMLGTYTFKSLNYIVMVIFLTPYVLILFHFLGLGALDVASERLLDTAIGSLLAFLASYFLFPQWESAQLQNYMSNVLKANIHYLQKLKDLFAGRKITTLDYNLARKELFVSTANLSAAFHRMLSEPKNKQAHRKQIYEFVVLNHVLSSNVASLTASMRDEEGFYSKEVTKPVKTSIGILEKSLQKLETSYSPRPIQARSTTEVPSPEIFIKKADRQLKEQLDFICNVSINIGRMTDSITS
jgi:uncharacterized membrane protein YccC